MQLITKVEVSNFRSIREACLNDLGHFNALAGLNNAGKSNFLRSLNTFFVGEVERGEAFNIDRDYYRPEIKKKKKKAIRIKIYFNLPLSFKFRKGLESAELLLGREFALTKEWTRERQEPFLFLNDSHKALDFENSQKIESFLNLITFRYIPNRVIPTEIIVREHQALRDVLVRRLAKYKMQAEAVFKGIKATADQLTKDLDIGIGKFVPNITHLRLSTASSLADLAFRFGYILQEGEVEMEENEQGSGLQSLLMFQTLHLIDQDYFQKFGWRQASIWAVEEPESSLHTALEARVARYISSICQKGESRLQTIATTHSDLMIQYSDCSYIVDKRNVPLPTSSINTVVEKLEKKVVLRKAARYGISRWVNPVLLYPLNPIVLVEGRIDKDFIDETNTALGKKPKYIVVCLEDLLEDPEKGGVDTLRRFVFENRDAICARAVDAPVIVILDWDAAKRKKEFEKQFNNNDPYRVIAWDVEKANPKLHKSFRGIERFYSDRLINTAEQINENLISTKRNGLKCVQADEFNNLKKILHGILKKGLEPTDCGFARFMIEQLEHLAN